MKEVNEDNFDKKISFSFFIMDNFMFFCFFMANADELNFFKLI